MVTTNPPAPAQDKPASQTISVYNPITGALIGTVPAMSAGEVRAAVERARAAQSAWEAIGVKARVSLLRRWKNRLFDERKRIGEIIRSESGKSEGGALTEVLVTDLIATFYCRQAPKHLKPQKRTPAFPIVHRTKVYYKPYGVVGFIVPWNYPLLNGVGDVVAALLAGNTAVIKPSELTPHTAIAVVDLMHEVGIPRDVVQIVTGAGETGAALVDDVDYVAFTGSTAVGRKIAVRCAERLIPCSLELGGKDPAIIMPDADLDAAAKGVLTGALENTGQACVSTERVYVDRSIYQPFMEKLIENAHQLKFCGGDGLDVHFGSLTHERELKRVEEHVRDAVERGAKIAFGGSRRPDLGPLFHEPTILTDVDHSMKVMQEETFGPLIPVMQVNGLDEAIRLSNDNDYGLSASIFTRDIKRAEQIATHLVAGDVAINHPQLTFGSPGAPMGGAPGRQSGLGRRNGIEGLMRFVSPQAVTIDYGWATPPDLSHTPPRTVKLGTLMHYLRRYLPI